VVIVSDTRNSLLGVTSAFIVALAAIGGGAWVMIKANPYAGGVLSAIGLGGIVSTFIYGTRSRRAEREARRE